MTNWTEFGDFLKIIFFIYSFGVNSSLIIDALKTRSEDFIFIFSWVNNSFFTRLERNSENYKEKKKLI